jgi:hypothetical protein
MDWTVVKDWLILRGYAHEGYEVIEVGEDSVYLQDPIENTWISLFANHGNLIVFVGTIAPHISAGGDTGWACESPWDAIDYLKDHMESLWEALNIKIMEHYTKKMGEN